MFLYSKYFMNPYIYSCPVPNCFNYLIFYHILKFGNKVQPCVQAAAAVPEGLEGLLHVQGQERWL